MLDLFDRAKLEKNSLLLQTMLLERQLAEAEMALYLEQIRNQELPLNL